MKIRQIKSSIKQTSSSNVYEPDVLSLLKRYWQKNLLLTIVLLLCWFGVGLGCSVLLADRLNLYKLAGTGFPLGFWFAHQGSIIVFVLLILAYCLLMNRLDNKHHNELRELCKSEKG